MSSLMGRRKGALIAVALVFLLSSCMAPVAGSQNNVGLKNVSPTILEEAARMPHTRLFASTLDAQTLAAEISNSHKEIWQPIQEYVSSQLNTPPPANAPQTDNLRSYGNRLIPFAFACKASGDAQVCGLAKQYMLAYSTWKRWDVNQERDLGLAHMLLGNSLAYDWLYNQLTDPERLQIRTSLGNWAQKMYEASTSEKVPAWNNWWTDSYAQNHYFIDHSALGMAGLALLGEDNRAETWLNRAIQQLTIGKQILDGVNDGSWHESMSYQSYMLTLTIPFWVNLRQMLKIDLIPHIYMQNYIAWRVYNYLPNTTEHIMAHGDLVWEHSDYRPQNIFRFLANEYQSGYAEWLAEQQIAADGRYNNVWATPWYVFEFLYYNPNVQPSSPVGLPLQRDFRDLEGVIWRTGWGPNDLVFGLKTGAYGGRFIYDTFTQNLPPWTQPCGVGGDACKMNFGHDHDDTNTFYLYKAGHWLAPETVGVNSENSSFHNTLLIDGHGQNRPSVTDQRDEQALSGLDGSLQQTAYTDSFSFLSADATKRYSQIGDIQKVTRYVLFVRPGYFFMVDDVQASSPHQYVWVSHFGGAVTVKGSWVRADVGDNQVIGVNYGSPDAYKVTTGNDGNPFVHIQPASAQKSVQFFNLLYPTDAASWGQRPQVNVVENTGEYVYATVQTQTQPSQTDEILIRYSDSQGMLQSQQYAFDGEAAVVTRDANGQIQKAFMLGGTVLTDKSTGIDLLRTKGGSGPIEVQRRGNRVLISGSISGKLYAYAPGANLVVVNGVPEAFSYTGNGIVIGNSNYSGR